MATHIQHVKQWQRDPNQSSISTTEEVTEDNVVPARANAKDVANRVVWFIAGILISLLGLRFVLALLGANTSNAFAHFIYAVTLPFVSPFFTLFNYNLSYSASHFELYTLFAILIYALIAYGITRLINLTRDKVE